MHVKSFADMFFIGGNAGIGKLQNSKTVDPQVSGYKQTVSYQP
jgi:hypothetical protein